MASFWETGMSGLLSPFDDKNVPQSLRQKIALAMLMQKRALPKTFGEGLASIGDSLGDAMMTRGIYRDAAAGELAGKAARDEFTGGSLPAAKSYGDTGDVSEAPATRAINTAIAPAPQPSPGLTTAAAQPASVLSPQGMSGLGGQQPAGPSMNMLNPAPMMAMARPAGLGAGAPPEQGGYNLIDAQAGMKRLGQGRVQDAVTGAYPGNPDMQAYASQLAAGEQQRPGETSSTGARGPWQFVPGTARQYGLSNPDDPDASAMALKRFTADNAATFERTNGRPPTMADLAVMHQQGGQTGANMIAGTGNATPRNLALNNVPSGAGPEQAAARIKGYYGLPDREVNARDSLAASLVAQQQPAPQPAQPAPQGDQRLAFDGPSPPAPSGIRTAPPVEPQVRAAPQQPGQLYITPKPAQVPEAGIEPMSDTEQRIRRKIENTPPAYRDSVQQALTPLLEQEVSNRSIRQKQREEAHKEQATHNRALDLKREDQLYGAPKTAADIAHIQQQIATGKIIQMEGRAYRVQDDGTLKDITPGQSGDGPPQIKMTQDQSDTLKFYKMGKTAATQLEGKERLLAEGWKEELAGKVPFAGNKLLSSQYRAAKYAAGLLVQADLRDTSGATIGTQEYKDRYELLIPKPGDDALAMQNKAEARQAVLEGQRLALGTARPMADYVDKEHAKTRAEKAATLNREMEGKDKGKTYEKNGVFRRWAGDHWEEH